MLLFNYAILLFIVDYEIKIVDYEIKIFTFYFIVWRDFLATLQLYLELRTNVSR